MDISRLSIPWTSDFPCGGLSVGVIEKNLAIFFRFFVAVWFTADFVPSTVAPNQSSPADFGGNSVPGDRIWRGIYREIFRRKPDGDDAGLLNATLHRPSSRARS
jgi:hypothetical protein